ncbi:amidohydrolase family protein [Kitasatospora arboriphila]
MFTQMRTLLAIQRMRAVNAAHASGGTAPAPGRIGTADVLDFATLRGARTCGLDGVTGSLTPGKQADLLLLTADEIKNLPLNDPVGAVVLGWNTRTSTPCSSPGGSASGLAASWTSTCPRCAPRRRPRATRILRAATG